VRDYTQLREKHHPCHLLFAKSQNPCGDITLEAPPRSLYPPAGQIYISMLTGTILNPQLLSLLARVRHTNTLVIADRGFPFWPEIETVDISLMDDVPTVLQVLQAIRGQFHAVTAFMAKEFLEQNTTETRQKFAQALEGIPTQHEAHVEFKKRVPKAIGLVRTGDTIQFANTILVSG
jgi:D-ribose pyranase